MTWLDALLVTLLGMLAALGMRQGASGLLWGLLVLFAAYLANILSSSLGPVGSVIFALGLGLLASLAMNAVRDAVSTPFQTPSVPAAGSGFIGAVALGAALIGAVALAFPLSPRVEASGVRYVYPAPEMQSILYNAVDKSAIKDRLMPLWDNGSPLRALVLPDRMDFRARE